MGTGPFQWSGTTIAPGPLQSNNNQTLGASSGTLTGTPTYTGTQPDFILLSGASQSVGIEYDYVIGGTGSSQAFTNTPSPATQGQSYSFQFQTTWTNQLGCDADLTFVFGSIPPGLSLNLLAGSFSGTPTVAGQYTMTVFAYAGTACASTATNLNTFTLTINPAQSPATPPGASNWTRTGSAAQLSPSTSGWDSFLIGSPSVVKVGGTYYLYYEGMSSSTHLRSIGLATSTDGATWTKSSANPVIAPGASGAWDQYGARYPTVYYDGNQFRLWYQGNGANGDSIGLATSPDGVTWTKSSGNPVITATGVISSYAPGAVVNTGSTYVMYYNADGSISTLTSPDGVAWSSGGTVVASSSSVRLGRPTVILDGSTYRMWYTRIEQVGGGAAASPVYPLSIGYTDSPDGSTWTTYGNPVLTAGSEGAWDRPEVGDPTVIKDGSVFRMWYAGGRGNLPGGTWDGNAFVEGSIGSATAPY